MCQQNAMVTEIARMLGCMHPDAALQDRIQTALEQVQQAAQPRAVWRYFPLEQQNTPSVAGIHLIGSDIARHLLGCHAVVLMAATLSASADSYLRCAASEDLSFGLIADAAAGVLVEQLCHDTEAAIRAQIKSRFLTERFSPGYGDLPITLQADLLRLLDAQRTIGLTATPQSTLLPMKSVTAILGCSEHPVQDARRFGCGSSCALCPHKPYCMQRRTDESSLEP